VGPIASNAAEVEMKLFVLLLAAVVAFPGTVPAGQTGGIETVEFSVALQDPVVRPGAPIMTVITLRNTGATKLKPVFQERDAQGRVLPYPVGLTARVIDESGRILTENDVSKDEWWSWYYTWPSVNLVLKESKSRLNLKPGRQIVRTVDLNKILDGNEALANGFPAGTYTVQFTLNGLRSNQVTLQITDGSRP
jgi:hypothetical protein